MASISFRHLYKKYPGGVTAVSDFTLEVKDKEFIEKEYKDEENVIFDLKRHFDD